MKLIQIFPSQIFAVHAMQRIERWKQDFDLGHRVEWRTIFKIDNKAN